jgi:hypothetical protein
MMSREKEREKENRLQVSIDVPQDVTMVKA